MKQVAMTNQFRQKLADTLGISENIQQITVYTQAPEPVAIYYDRFLGAHRSTVARETTGTVSAA